MVSNITKEATRTWLECERMGFLVEMSLSDVLTAVTGSVPDVLRLKSQVTGMVQPPGDL
jgi:hypothetical protein